MLAQGAAYGASDMGAGRRVVVEFVSANPTGPLHVGHGRHAAYGASLANLLEAAGYRVGREYYVNDAGRQMEILAASTWLRYLERRGERFAFPANGYRGDYLLAIAAELDARHGDALVRPAAAVFEGLPPDEPQGGDKDVSTSTRSSRAPKRSSARKIFGACSTWRSDRILADIREDLEEFGVTFDSWFSERSLSDSGEIDRAIAALEAAGHDLREGRRALVQDHGLRRRERSRDRARERHQDLFRVRHRLHLEQARARLRASSSTCGARITTATWRVCAPG